MEIGKRNMASSSKIDNEFMSTNCDIIVLLRVYGQFASILKPDSGNMVCITYIFTNCNLFS